MPLPKKVRTVERVITVENPALRFIPTGPADTEIEWFFTLSEADMVPRAIHYDVLLVAPPRFGESDDSSESQAEACKARGVVLSWLEQLILPHAGVLQAAYEARPWPLALRSALGRATGVVVRLRVAEVGLPETQEELEALELSIARQLDNQLESGGIGALGDLLARAETLLRAAFGAYEHARGPMRPLLYGVSR